MSDPSRPTDVKGTAATGRAAPPTPEGASTASEQEVRAPLSATSSIPSEDELDWRENQSRAPAQSTRLNALLIALFALASAAGIAVLVLLYRFVF